MEESLLYIQRIKAMYQSRTFSKSDRLIADYILAHPTCVASTTAAELGEVTRDELCNGGPFLPEAGVFRSC